MSKRHRNGRKCREQVQLVYGEDVDVLLDLLVELYGSAEPCGKDMFRFGLVGTAHRLKPLVRAITRADAELLIADAERGPLRPRRTPDNRRFDALELVTWRALAARNVPGAQHRIRALAEDDGADPAA